jgi:hypothetical protein
MTINSTTIGQKAEARASGASGRQAGDEFTQAREHLITEFKQAFTAWKRALYVERRAIGLSLFDAGLRAAVLAGVTISWLAVAVTATLLFVGGARRGLQLWTGGAWWSDVVLAIALVGMLAGAAHAVRRFVHRSTLEKTRRVLNDPARWSIGAASKEAS